MQAATAMNTLHTAQLVIRLEMRIAAKALVHSTRLQKVRCTSLERKITRMFKRAVSYGGAQNKL